jgi:hypothetical protein
MTLADSPYPLLNLFWTMFIFFLWVIWIWVLIWVFIDIFRSHDLSGWAKALWFLFVLFIPGHRRAGLSDRPAAARCKIGRRGGLSGSTRSSLGTSSQPQRTHRPARRTCRRSGRTA